MTERLEVDGDREPLSQRAARRLRGALAENRISGTALAAALHLPQQTLSRKVNGVTPFSLDELDLVATTLGVQLDAVLGLGAWEDRALGRLTLAPVAGRPAAPGGGRAFLPLGREGWCASRDLNPEPADYASAAVLQLVRRSGVFSTVPRSTATHATPTGERRLRLVGAAS